MAAGDDGERGIARRTVGGQPALGALTDLADLLGGDSDRSRRLLGGLMAGALVGAMIAGTLLRARAARPPRR